MNALCRWASNRGLFCGEGTYSFSTAFPVTAWKGFWLLTGELPGSSSYSGMLCFVVVEEEEGAAGGGVWSALSTAKGSEGVLVIFFLLWRGEENIQEYSKTFSSLEFNFSGVETRFYHQ